MKTANIRTKWRELLETSAKADRSVLRLMMHPDTTQETLAEVHKRCVERRKQLTETYHVVNAKCGWPYVQAPWWLTKEVS